MKFKIKDENGKEFEIEEINEHDEETTTVKPVKKPEDVHDEGEALSKEEISALKELAAIAPELKKLLEVERGEHAGDETETDTHDDEPAGEPDRRPEEVVDTCHDSKSGRTQARKAAGSIERKTVGDSISNVDDSLEIEDAWQRRYNGGAK